MNESSMSTEAGMFVVYDSVTGQITQLVFDTIPFGKWTRADREWFPLASTDMSTFVLSQKYISREHFQEALNYFDDQTEKEALTYEPEYRMWFI